MMMSKEKVLPIIKTALKEDIGPGDITSKLIVPDKKMVEATILAKEAGVVCGIDVAKLVFKTVDRRIRFQAQVKDGQRIKSGKALARLEGAAGNILKAERMALNFLSRLSGVATLTDKFVRKVRPYPVKIMDTRKTTPGLRVLEKYAVRCGGGFNHRMGLWGQILVKENHVAVYRIAYAACRKKALTEIIEKIKQRRPKGVKIEVEVGNLAELRQALTAAPDIILLDNFSIKDIKKAVEIRSGKQRLEVSGRVSLNTVRRIAACGVEMISVGALTHSVQALDVALNCG